MRRASEPQDSESAVASREAKFSHKSDSSKRMKNAPWTVWRKRDLAYQVLIHALAVIGAGTLISWIT